MNDAEFKVLASRAEMAGGVQACRALLPQLLEDEPQKMRRATHVFGRALRESGQALDRLGLTFSNNEIYKDTFSRHRSVMNLFDKVRSIVVSNG
jgi:hypothetical protein